MDDANRFDLPIIIATAKRVITGPATFYRSMPVAGGYANPMIFLIVMSVVAGLIGSVWAAIGMGPAAGVASGLLTVILMPIFVVIGSFIGGLFVFVIWKLMGSTQTYEASYRCLAFATAILPIVAIANLVPYLGQALNAAWGLGLMVIASTEVHRIRQRTALIVFGIIGVLSLYSSVAAERQARKAEAVVVELQARMDQVGKTAAEMTAEDMGRAATDFLAGVRQGSTGEALTAEEKAAVEEAGAAFGQVMGGLQQVAEDLEAGEIDSAEKAGAALGALFGQIAANVNQGQQRDNAANVLRNVPDLATVDIEALTSLGSIEQPSARHTLLFAVDDDGRTAPLSAPVQVYRDSGGLRYQLRMSSDYLTDFRSLGDQQAQMDSASEVTITASGAGAAQTVADGGRGDRVQNIAVRNAGIYIYDENGDMVGGDECDRSVIQIAPATDADQNRPGIGLSLWCPMGQRRQLGQ